MGLANAWFSRRSLRWNLLDPDLRLEQARALALRAAAWFRELVFRKQKPARFAARGFDDDVVADRPCRADHVPQGLFDVAAFEPQLAREAGHRPRLLGEQLAQALPDGHRGQCS